jgi:hypothetical protein
MQVVQLTNQVQVLIRFAAHVTRENRELALRLEQAAAQGSHPMRQAELQEGFQEGMQDDGLGASGGPALNAAAAVQALHDSVQLPSLLQH